MEILLGWNSAPLEHDLFAGMENSLRICTSVMHQLLSIVHDLPGPLNPVKKLE